MQKILNLDVGHIGTWVFFQWPFSGKTSDIIRDMTFVELVPLQMRKNVLFQSYNLSFVSVVNKHTSQSKRVMKLGRHLVLMLMEYNFICRAKHFQSSNNTIVDSISHQQWSTLLGCGVGHALSIQTY